MSEKSKPTYQVSYERYGEGMVRESLLDLDALKEWLIDFKVRAVSPEEGYNLDEDSLVILECRDVTGKVEPPADKLEERMAEASRERVEAGERTVKACRVRELECLAELAQRYPDEARELLGLDLDSPRMQE